MAASVSEIVEWLKTLHPDDEVGIDDGGLALRSMNEPDAYLEIGGMPEDFEGDEL